MVFGEILQALNTHLFMTHDDAVLLGKVAKTFSCDGKGDMFHGLLNVNNLKTIAPGTNPEIFNLPSITTAANTLLHKVG